MKSKWMSPSEAAERRAEIAKLRDECGLSFDEIGKRFGITSSTARQLHHSYHARLKREKLWENHWAFGLSTRTNVILCAMGVNSLREAKSRFKELNPFSKRKPRGYGWKTHVELARFLGLPEPQKRKPSVFVGKVCPHCNKSLV